MLHIEFPYLRVAKILLIPLRAFLAHLLRIDEMGFRAFHVDIILEMGEQVTLIVHSSVLISQYLHVSRHYLEICQPSIRERASTKSW